MGLIIAIWIIHAVACAFFAHSIATSKGRSPGAWFFAGLLFGIVGLLAIGLHETATTQHREQERIRSAESNRIQQLRRLQAEGDVQRSQQRAEPKGRQVQSSRPWHERLRDTLDDWSDTGW